ncbi:MAG: SUMF1/EgtB/PvdO family nonheme iron enzyme [Candidatus Sumerlaeia bacterium]|nr:SUMF1/EgtB/PvdO family nonheme iron enzyme [Candidatus Sumerlaeia bacterium]
MDTLAPGSIILGKYEIVKTLGAGGMGAVYRARQLDLGRDVAIKVPHPAALEVPGFLARFVREAKTVARLTHENIVQIYEFHDGPEGIYIVMEYVEGRDLQGVIQKPPPGLRVRDLGRVLSLACEGISRAHEMGIVHRDIKPHNMMVADLGKGRWRVKVMDFGIAHIDSNSQMTSGGDNLTVTGQAIGTPTYMSPEQVRGASDINHLSDLYSFGCVMFYCFSRKTVFEGTPYTVAAKHLSERPPSVRAILPDVPAEFDALVAQCLEKDPRHRPQDAHELGERIMATLGSILDRKMTEVWGSMTQFGAQPIVAGATLPSTPALATDDTMPSRATDLTEPSGAAFAGKTKPISQDTYVETVDDIQRTTATDDLAGARLAEAKKRVAEEATWAMAAPSEAPAPLVSGGEAGATMVSATKVGTAPAPAAPPAPVVQAEPAAAPGSSKKMIFGGLAGLTVIAAVVLAAMLTGGGGEPDNSAAIPGPTPSPTATPAPVPTGAAAVPVPTPEPTTAPVPTAEATVAPGATTAPPPRSTPRPTASPEGTATPTRADQKLADLRRDFEASEGFAGWFRVWDEAMESQRQMRDERFLALADEVALTIAKNPVLAEVPAGAFTRGRVSDGASPDEGPVASITLSAYSIGRHEVTALEFATFLNRVGAQAGALYTPEKEFNIVRDEKTGRYAPLTRRELHPANGVTWHAAVAYTEWLSREAGAKFRLPTEAEWERAARGRGNATYPWGTTEPDGTRANFGQTAVKTVPVNAADAGAAQETGALNMAGNVAEWCLDYFGESFYTNTTVRENPRNDSKPAAGVPRRVLRGGSFFSNVRNLGVTVRGRQAPDDALPEVGFRIVREG